MTDGAGLLPTICINGYALTPEQVRTVQLALSDFLHGIYLQGLGSETEIHLTHAEAVFSLLLRRRKGEL